MSYAGLSTSSTDEGAVGKESTSRAEGVGLDLKDAVRVGGEIILNIVGSSVVRELGWVVLGFVKDEHLCGGDEGNVLSSHTGFAYNSERALGQ